MNKNLNPPETIRAVLKSNKYSDLMVRGWIAVSRLETGNWQKSPKLFGEYNNGFGMGVPKVRKSLANGSYFDRVSNMRYSTYSTFANSVRDVVLWMQYSKFPEPCDASDFAQQLVSRGYATDPNYSAKIQKLMA